MPLKRFYNEIGLFLYHAMTIVRGNDSSGSDPGKKSFSESGAGEAKMYLSRTAFLLLANVVFRIMKFDVHKSEQ